MEFFRIVGLREGHHSGFGIELPSETSESTLQEVALELVLTVGLSLLVALLLRYGPVSWELGLGALVNHEHRRVAPSSAKRPSTRLSADAAEVRSAPLTTAVRNAPSGAAELGEASSGAQEALTAVERKRDIVPSDERSKPTAAPTSAEPEHRDDRKHGGTHQSHHHHHHCDLDAALDEFCEEEELMDEAFIASIADQHSASASGSKGNPLQVEGVKVDREARTSGVQPPAVSVPNVSSTQSGASKRATESTSIEKELAKRMMRAIDRSPTRGGNTDSDVKARGTSRGDTTQKVVESAPARTAPPQPPSKGKATLPSPPTPASVDLDAAFDELQSCEDALSEALVDSVVEESHVSQVKH